VLQQIAGEVEIFVMCRGFSYESLGGRILKISPHLPQLLSNIKQLTFLEHKKFNKLIKIKGKLQVPV